MILEYCIIVLNIVLKRENSKNNIIIENIMMMNIIIMKG